MEKQLVSFGNFLLGSAGNRSEAVKCQVTDADLRNWQDETGISIYGSKGTPHHGIGDKVKASCLRDDAICTVLKAHVSATVQFDLEVEYFDPTYERKIKTRIYNVDSALIYASA